MSPIEHHLQLSGGLLYNGPMVDHSAEILKMARSRILRPRDLRELDAPRGALTDLVRSGELVRTARGLYVAPDLKLSEHHSLAEVSKRWPQAVICLLSALQFHELTLELPAEVWIAVPRGFTPRSKDMRIRIVQVSAQTFSEGIGTHLIEGVPVRIYSPARTVADCFKFRSQVGVSVAYEALRNAWLQRKAGADELVHFAKLCRVYNVMRPYFETLA